MDFPGLLTLLGQSPDNPALRQHLSDHGIDRQPQPAPDEGMAFVRFGDAGYDLRFDLDNKNGRVALTSIQVFPKGDDDHRPFTGLLPGDLSLTDKRDDLLARFGQPTQHNEVFCIDMWRREHVELCITYDEGDMSIEEIQYNLAAPAVPVSN